MFMEITQFPVKAGREADFEAVIAKTMPGFKVIKGYQGYELRRVVEAPTHYYLMVRWEKLEDHTVTYAQSDFRKEVGVALGPFADGRPIVEHGRLVAS